MKKPLIITAALFAVIAVALGAFGAHGLKSVVSEYQVGIWNKGVQYQFYHALAILCTCSIAQQYKLKKQNITVWLFSIGIVLFSGSLFLLALKDVLNLDASLAIIGPATPIGGLFFILAWLHFIFQMLKSQQE